MNQIPLIICAAGLGSRVFPASWALCKELFPLDNKPALHHVLEEALNADIKNVHCIISKYKESIRRYLEYHHEQQEIILNLQEKERLNLLDELNKNFNYYFWYQDSPLGIGNALSLPVDAYQESDYVAIVYPDDIYDNKIHGLSTVMEVCKKYLGSCIALEEIPIEKTFMYGVIDPKKQIDENVYAISRIVEKPSLEETPSNLSIVGRYILHKDLFLYLKKQKTEKPCSIRAMNEMIKDGYPFYATKIPARRFDIGSIKGWQEAVIEFSKNFK
jgi:UTP--glucose-1-phosphate uridylyltransferase